MVDRELEQRLAVLLDVVDVAHLTEARCETLQDALALAQREAAQIASLDAEQIEGVEHDRDLVAQPLRLARVGLREAALQQLEGAASLRVEGRDLAVQHELARRQARERARDLGVDRAHVAAAARAQPDLVAVADRERAHAVELGLEEMRRRRERRVRVLGEHRAQIAGRELAARRARRIGERRQLLAARRARAQLLDRQAREHRRRLIRHEVGARLARLVDQQPVAPAAPLGADQRELAAQLVALEDQVELAVLHPLHGRAAVDRAVAAPIPDDHGACAVIAVRDHTLEVGVLDRVVLGVHGQALLARVEARPPGHRPARQHPPDLEAQVPVQGPGRMLLDHEEPAVGRAPWPRIGLLPEGLRRARGVAHLAITSQVGRPAGARVWHESVSRW